MRSNCVGHDHHRAALLLMTHRDKRVAIHAAANVAAVCVMAALIAAVKLLVIR
jgi:hypothetical protein